MSYPFSFAKIQKKHLQVIIVTLHVHDITVPTKELFNNVYFPLPEITIFKKRFFLQKG